MPDHVRHDESGTAWLQPNVKRSKLSASSVLGQHNAEILTELGYSGADMAALKEEGAI